jgi:hypothetical protein
MAVINYTLTKIETFGDHSHVVTWTPLANGDTGTPLEMSGSVDRSVQVSGTFGAGGSVSIEGSNNSTNFIVLTDPQGNAITKTTASIEQVTEISRLIRPNVTAGDGTTALTVTLLVRGSALLR